LHTTITLSNIDGGKSEMSKDTQFKPGNPGGPGRPLGSKNRLSEYFLFELADHFEEHGREAIERVCQDSPGEYLRIIASLTPKDFALEISDTKWVINAGPKTLTVEQWREMHGLATPENEQGKIGCGE
jgi:hypothetical protein